MATTTTTIPFGPLGEVVFYRTYSRQIDPDDPTKGCESFRQAIDRVVSACNSQLDCGFTDAEKEELKTLLLSLKGSVAGRFMWQLGTKTVDRLGLVSLQNCAAMVLNDPVKCYTWLFDLLMLGVGVGFNIEDENIQDIEPVRYCEVEHIHTSADAPLVMDEGGKWAILDGEGYKNFYLDDNLRPVYLVPDSREGWVELLGHVLTQHFPSKNEDSTLPGVFTFNTICVREKGQPIKTFGGVSSGHETLVWGIIQINRILNAVAGRRPKSVTLLDVANIVGHIVVSGNVRRSAQIAVGTAENKEYLAAKQWSHNTIPFWRSNSNNSVVVTRFRALPDEFWNGYDGGGEPYGLVNLDLCRRAGQIAEGAPHKEDPDVVCVNPCVTAGTTVMTEVGPVPIGVLAGEWPTMYTQPPTGVLVHSEHFPFSRGAWLSRRSADIVRINTNEGYSLECTPDHRIVALRKADIDACSTLIDSATLSGEFIPAGDLSLGDVVILNRGVTPPPSWPGFVHIPGTETSREACEATGYALGHLIGDGKIDLTTPEVQDAVFRVYLSGERSDPTVLDPVKAWIERALMDHRLPARNGWLYSSEKDAVVGNKYVYVRDRNFMDRVCRPLGIVHGNKHVTPAIESTNSTFQAAVVAGLFDTDGAACVSTQHVTISQGHLQTLEILQRILLSFDIVCAIMQTHRSDTRRRPVYDLRLRPEHIGRFLRTIPVKHLRKLANLRTIYASRQAPTSTRVHEPSVAQDVLLHRAVVSSVESAGQSDVYDLSVKGIHAFAANGVLVSNCGEQPLANFETCCLGEVFLPNCETIEVFKRIVYYLYRICKHSLALPCHWPETAAIVHKNMRMGISITGYLQATKEQRLWLPQVALWMDGLDVDYSASHGFPRSIKLRTVKPSGSLSLIPGVTAGGHPAPFRYYIKRMRMAADSYLAKDAQARGYHVEPLEYEVADEDTGKPLLRYDERTVVVDFPVTHGEDVLTADDMTAIDQLEVVRRLQADWSDNSVSVTVKYDQRELPAIKEYLLEHWRNGFKAASFLLRNDHGFRQAPWTKITREEYHSRIKEITRPFGGECEMVDIERLRVVDADELADNAECAGGSCPRR